jgi:DNA-binding NarL/FixJ family response regulator
MEHRNQHNRITIVLADDHPLLRKGLRETIEDEHEFSVVAETGNGESALSYILQLHPDLAVLDVDMPKMNGLDVAAAVQKNNLSTKVVILTMYNDETFFNKAIDLGVYGYLLKDNAVSEIIEALNQVADGKYYYSPSLSDLFIKRCRKHHQHQSELPGLSALTQMERKILYMVAENIANKDIAEQLFISARTVETHRNNICQKLQLQGTNALLMFALKHKSIL